jgi:uncharacterized membrane protein
MDHSNEITEVEPPSVRVYRLWFEIADLKLQLTRLLSGRVASSTRLPHLQVNLAFSAQYCWIRLDVGLKQRSVDSWYSLASASL